MDDDNRDDGPDEEAPAEQATEQRVVPFMDDELAAAMTISGAIYITLPGLCSALGLNLKGQMQRIKRTRALATSIRLIPRRTVGGIQRINCLRVDKIALWLAGVQTDRLKPPFRPKIEAYQDELAPVAMQVFLRVAGIRTADLAPAPSDPRVAALAQQIDDLGDVVNLLREHLAGLATAEQVVALSLRLDQAIALLGALAERHETAETQIARIDARTQRLTPARARTVQELVDRMVRDTKHLLVPLTYAAIYGRLKQRFRVASYREVSHERFDEVMDYLLDELRRISGGQAPAQSSLF